MAPACPSNFFALDVTAPAPIATSPFVQASGTGPRRRVVIDFKPSLGMKCSQASIVVEYEGLPTLWSVNIGDSATNDGHGGGGIGACAEVLGRRHHGRCEQALRRTDVGRDGDGAAAQPGPLSLRDGALKFVVRDQYLSVGQPYATPAAADLPKSFHLPDTFGPSPDGYKIYAGFNGVIEPWSTCRHRGAPGVHHDAVGRPGYRLVTHRRAG